MPYVCAVFGCYSHGRKKEDNIRFHRFPKDKEIQQKWIHLCYRKDPFNAAHSRVCSLHFESEDYQRNLKYELLKMPVPKRLVKLEPSAVPTLNLPQGKENAEPAVRNSRTEKRNQKKLAQDIIDSANKNQRESQSDNEVILGQLEETKKERDALLADKKEWESERDALLKKLNTNAETIECVKSMLSKVFSPSQVNYFLTGKTVKYWSTDDISKALTLRSLSTKAYRFLKEKWNIPLPSVSTLNRWVSKLDVEPGLLNAVFNLMQHKAEALPERERVCVMSFDECSISSEWSYDKGTDTLYAPKKKVQCVMIRGIVGSWKQLIFYDFDCNMKKIILFELISKTEAAGYPVVALVNDLGPSNVGLWNSLGVGWENCSFINPVDPDREIYVFADAPHLIKLIRNHLIDHGYLLSKGKYALIGCIREIFERSKSDLKTIHKLSEKHFPPKGVKRMSVKLAVQLLSETTAKSLMHFGDKGLLKSRYWNDTAQFITLADSWFDIFNSRVPFDMKLSRNAYGKNLSLQNKVLEDMIETSKSMIVCGSKVRNPFQKGLIVSSESLRLLLTMLTRIYDISYILSYRLNQDVLEHFFGCIRQMGACFEHPSPVVVKYRIRTYLLGKDTSLMGDNYNSQKECSEKVLSEGSMVSTENEKSQVSDDSQQALEREICLSAMLFSTLEEDISLESGDVQENEFVNNENLQDITFEQAMAMEGLRYFGGFIAKKFPQYPFLKSEQKSNEKTWIEEIERIQGKLIHPSPEFLSHLEKMENLFKCHHGEKGLKAGKCAIHNLAGYIEHFVNLPKDVVNYFVRCRMFFRMRVLNREIESSRKKAKKMSKIVK